MFSLKVVILKLVKYKIVMVQWTSNVAAYGRKLRHGPLSMSITTLLGHISSIHTHANCTSTHTNHETSKKDEKVELR